MTSRSAPAAAALCLFVLPILLAHPATVRSRSSAASGQAGETVAFVGARILDGTGAPPVENGVLVVRDGRVAAVGPAGTAVPDGARRVDVAGRTILPGLVNAHGHVSNVRGLKGSPEFYTPEHVRAQLALYARYGVTTVFSLGDDGPAGIEVRDAQRQSPDRARFFLAGPVIAGSDAAAVRKAVDEVIGMNVDLVKIRVDDNLGASPKMPPAAWRAAIEQAHAGKLRLAAHIFYLEDAKAILAAGGDFIAHSVRDQPVDAAFIEQLKTRDVCLCPTLMREVSTFVYETRPAFFDDPFFRRAADPGTIQALEAPSYQAAVRKGNGARYKVALDVAKANLKRLSDAGVRIAFGTDTGPAGRFQGYFEHLELEQMVSAGLTPMQALVSATGDAARCMKVDDRLGTLRPGREADFIVLTRNPLEDIRHTRTLEQVWIAGRQFSSAQ